MTPQQKLAMIDAELSKRSQKPDSRKEDELALIDAELGKRKKEGGESWLGSLGRGLLSGIGSMGLREGADYAEAFVDPKLAQGIREQADYLNKPAETPGGRIAHKIGEFTGGTASFPTGGTAANLAKLTGLGGVAGGLSGVATEAGVPEPIADIGAALLASPITKFARAPLQSTKNTLGAPGRWVEKQADKRARDVLQKVTEDIPDKKKAADLLQFQKKRDALFSDVGGEEAGQETRNILARLKEKLEGSRRSETAPLYEKLRKSKTRMEVPATEGWFKENNPVLKGDILGVTTKLEKDLFKNWKPGKLKGQDALEKLDVPPHIREQIESQISKEKRMVLPIETENLVQAARNKRFDSVGSEKTVLSDLIGKLEEDLNQLPEGLAHTKKYAEMSKPISRLTSQTRFGKVLEKEPTTGFYKMEDDKVADKILTSKARTRDLIEAVKDDPAKLQKLKDYIKFSAADQVVGPDGQVSLQKLKTWKAKYKGAFDLDATLHNQLEDIESAQKLTKKISLMTGKMSVLQGVEELPFSTFKKFLPSMGVKAGLLAKIMKKATNPLINESRDNLLAQAQLNPDLAEALLTPLKDKKTLNQRINKIPLPVLQRFLRGDSDEETPFAKGGSTTLRKAAKTLQGRGRGGDRILAHINPIEAMLLKKMGGSGTINPATGLKEFTRESREHGGAPSREYGYYSSSAHDSTNSPENRAAMTSYLTQLETGAPSYSQSDRQALDSLVRGPTNPWASAAQILGPAAGAIFGGPAGFALGGMLSRSMAGRESLSDSALGGMAANAVFPGASLLGELYSGLEGIRESVGGGVPFQRESADWGSTPDRSGGFWGGPPPKRHAAHNETRRWTELRHRPINRRYLPRPANHPPGEAWHYFDQVNPPWEFDYIEH